ncbi:MAG: hypothetical protein ACXQS5_06790 [Candidatus Methanospirareceae archaeon]
MEDEVVSGLPDWYSSMSFSLQRVAIVPRREWNAETESDVYFIFRGTVPAGTTAQVITYTVPSGETLFFSDLIFWGQGNGVVWLNPSHIFERIAGAACGAYDSKSVNFTLPLRVPSGANLIIEITNPTGSNVYYEFFGYGYLV